MAETKACPECGMEEVPLTSKLCNACEVEKNLGQWQNALRSTVNSLQIQVELLENKVHELTEQRDQWVQQCNMASEYQAETQNQVARLIGALKFISATTQDPDTGQFALRITDDSARVPRCMACSKWVDGNPEFRFEHDTWWHKCNTSINVCE